jgi:hypothetical protein
MADALKSDTQPLNQSSLEARICAWIEQNIASYLTSKSVKNANSPTGKSWSAYNFIEEDCNTKWQHVLGLVQEGHHYMHHGYGSAPPPTLAWLFSYGKAGEWNINRLVNQELDWIETFKSDDSTMR